MKTKKMNLLRTLEREVWLSTPESVYNLLIAAEGVLKGELPDEEDGDVLDYFVSTTGVGWLPIYGVMMGSPGLLDSLFLGVVDTQELIYTIERMVEDESVKEIVLDIDSPGGDVGGVYELSWAVSEATKRKPVTAFSSGQLCSAAYWVASQCSKIVVTPSSSIGSIGVFVPVYDISESLKKDGVSLEIISSSELKTTGYPGTSLSDKQREYLQTQVEEIFSDFKAAVLEKRKVHDLEEVFSGKVWLGKSALELGLVDEVIPSRFEFEKILDIPSLDRTMTQQQQQQELQNEPSEKTLEDEYLQLLEENDELKSRLTLMDELKSELESLRARVGELSSLKGEVTASVEKKIAELVSGLGINPIPGGTKSMERKTPEQLRSEFCNLPTPEARARFYKSLSPEEKTLFRKF